MIRDEIRIMWPCRASAMNGSASSSVTKIASIFGTKISVCSWIWVSAWISDTATPTRRPTIISGDDTTTMVQIASRAMSRVSAPVMFNIPLLPHGEERALARVSNHEPHTHPSRRGQEAAPQDEDRSNRHLHDVF